MSDDFTILVVCLGNVCRSPLAERLLQARIDAPGVRVASAGWRAALGRDMDPQAAAELQQRGGDPTGFLPRQLTGPMATEAGVVLTATRTLRSQVLEEAPRALKRTFTIRELAAIVGREDFWKEPVDGPAGLVARAATWRGSVAVDDYDVPDPIGRSADVHHEVAELLDQACTVIAGAVIRAVPE